MENTTDVLSFKLMIAYWYIIYIYNSNGLLCLANSYISIWFQWSHKFFLCGRICFYYYTRISTLRCALVAFVTARRLARSQFRLISVALDTPDVSSSATRNDHEKNRLSILKLVSPGWYRAAKVFTVLLSRPTLLISPGFSLSLFLTHPLPLPPFLPSLFPSLSYSPESWSNGSHIEGLTLKG